MNFNLCISGLVWPDNVPKNSGIASIVWISQNGEDTPSCLEHRPATHCKTVAFVLRLGGERIRKINVEGSPTPYTECHLPGIDASIKIGVLGLHIEGFADAEGHWPRFDCSAYIPQRKFFFVTIWTHFFKDEVDFRVSNVAFSNMALALIGPNLNAYFSGITFVDSFLTSASPNCESLHVYLDHVTVSSTAPLPFEAWFRPILRTIDDEYIRGAVPLKTAAAGLYCKRNHVFLTNSEIHSSLFIAIAYISLQVNFTNVVNKGMSAHTSNILFVLANTAHSSDGELNIINVTNFHSSDTWTKEKETSEFAVIRFRSKYVAVDDIYIQDSTFEDGSRSLYFSLQRLNTISIDNCTFQNNSALGVGGSIHCYVEIGEPGKLTISNSKFVQNKAKISTANVEAFSAGGAIFMSSKKYQCEQINTPNVIISNCLFQENYAQAFGGNLYLGIGVFMSMRDTQLIYDTEEHSWNGDVISADCRLEFTGVDIKIQSTNEETTGIEFVPVFDGAFIRPNSLTIECPVGHFLDLRYLLSPSQVNGEATGAFGSLQTYCRSCSQKAYTPNQGFAFINYSTEAAFSAENNIFASNVSCLPCPYGGDCNNGLLATRPKFWGYQHQGEFFFQRCPTGYCCNGDSVPCKAIDSCAPRRKGTLCGTCEEGYSESVLSTDCTRNEECNDYWVYPIYVLGALIYILYYAYKSELAFVCVTAFKLVINKCDRKPVPREAPDETKVEEMSETTKTMSTLTLQSFDVTLNPSPKHRPSVYGDEAPEENSENSQSQEGALQVKSPSKTSMLSKLKPMPMQNRLFLDAKLAEERPAKSEMQWFSLLTKLSHLDTKGKNKLLGAEDSDGVDRGYLGIITYFAQASGLMNVQIEFSSVREMTMLDTIEAYTVKYLDFDLYQVQVNVCPFAGINALFKSLIKTLFVLTIYCLWVFMFFVTYTILSCSCKNSSVRKLGNKFRLKLVEGLVEVIKYTYSSLAGSNFSLLTCIYIGNSLVWKLDGTVMCFQQWQGAAAFVLVFYTIPFCLSLSLGSQLLKEGKISSSHFLLSCILPLPFCVLWLFMFIFKWHAYKQKTSDDKSTDKPLKQVVLSDTAEVILDVLQGPYRDDETVLFLPSFKGPDQVTNDSNSKGRVSLLSSAVYWEGIMVFRRLVLNSLALVDNEIIRLTLISGTCLVFLVHHLSVRPFKLSRSNTAETISLSFLIILSGMNLVKATFSENGLIPEGPNETLLLFFQRTGNILVFILIGIVIVFELVAFFKNRRMRKKMS